MGRTNKLKCNLSARLFRMVCSVNKYFRLCSFLSDAQQICCECGVKKPILHAWAQDTGLCLRSEGKVDVPQSKARLNIYMPIIIHDLIDLAEHILGDSAAWGQLLSNSKKRDSILLCANMYHAVNILRKLRQVALSRLRQEVRHWNGTENLVILQNKTTRDNLRPVLTYWCKKNLLVRA